jgi:hypothetical protein
VTAWLTLRETVDPDVVAPLTLTRPQAVGDYTRMTGADVDAARAEALAQMADGPEVDDRFVEYYGDGSAPRLVLQAAKGTFRPGTNLFENEQRALQAGGATLRGEVDRAVNGITMQCDTGEIAGNVLGLCVHAVRGLLVIGTGINLDVDAVASLVAEAALKV